MLIAAIYARFSTDNQKDTSIDDQVRRARAVAERHGYVVPPEYVFSDAAVSGSVGAAGRPGYAALISAWQAGKFAAVLVDTQSRLFRDEVEAAQVKALVKKTSVRVVAHSGLDTATPGWELVWSMNAMIDSKYRQDVAVMVVRGMDGALERGFMVSPPPYGYRRSPEYSSVGDHVGTRFVIEPAEAAVVRRVFAERKSGLSYASIATRLNAEGVPAPAGGSWVVSSIVNILKCALYAGIYAANGSEASRYRSQKNGSLGPLTRRDYPRPELQLVSLADYELVKPGRAAVSNSGRGGGKLWLSGLCTCGVCGGRMSAKDSGKSVSLFCSRCSSDKALGAAVSVPYFSGDAVRSVLTYALQSLFTTESHYQAFRDKLLALREGGPRAQLEAAQARYAATNKTLERLARAIAFVDDDEVRASFRVEVEAASAAKRLAKSDVERLESGLSAVTSSVLDAQLSIDPVRVVPLIFGKLPAPELRAVLSRLFPRIVLHRAQGHVRAADVVVSQSVSACVSILSGTPEVQADPVERRFRALTSSRHNVPPVVQLLDSEGSVIAATDALRVCSCCDKTKPADEFAWQNRAIQRRQTRCRACASAYYRAWRAKAADAGLAPTAAWRAPSVPGQKNVVPPVNKSDVLAILRVAVS